MLRDTTFQSNKDERAKEAWSRNEMRKMDEIWREALRKQAGRLNCSHRAIFREINVTTSPAHYRRHCERRSLLSVHLVGFSLRRRWQHLADRRLLSIPPCYKTAFEETACNRGESRLCEFPPRQMRQTLDRRATPMLTIFGWDERCSSLLFLFSFFFTMILSMHRGKWAVHALNWAGIAVPFCVYGKWKVIRISLTHLAKDIPFIFSFIVEYIYIAVIEICRLRFVIHSTLFPQICFHFPSPLKLCSNILNWARIFYTYMEII